jgi:hypothetical protein
MQRRPRRASAARRPIRPSLDRVEQRRREILDDRGTTWWPNGAPTRCAAAFVVAGIVVSLFVGVGIAADAGIRAMASPALASIVTMHHRQRDEDRTRRSTAKVDRSEDRLSEAQRTLRHRPVALERRSGRKTASFVKRDPSSPLPAGPSPSSTPAVPAPTPVSSSVLSASPWRLTADGTWTATVSMQLPAGYDAAKAEVGFSSDAGDVLPLDGHALGAPGAIVTIAAGGQPVVVSASAVSPQEPEASIELPAPPADPATFGAVAETVGPHLIDVGWTPLPATAGVIEYKIYRRQAGERPGELIGVVSPTGHTWHDASVAPTTAYTYTVLAALSEGSVTASSGFIATPPDMQSTSIDAISGKGMFLYFVPDATDPNGYPNYDPDAVVAKAQSAGISHIELRLARGTFFEGSNPAARTWLDSFIDKADAAGIALIAWQVPRRATTDDAAQAVSIARYRTAAGNGFAGLALDIEDGENYMGAGDVARQRMVDEIQTVRQAVGPDYLVVATVMSPALTHWTNARYPYDRIAPYASVLQPMEYWHHFYRSTQHEYTQDEVTAACADSVSLTRGLAGRAVPINVAGQSDDLGATGPPSADEVGWCLSGSKAAGAVGQTFFDWRGTGDDVWSAIAGFRW